jgi:uncharacterized protein CbrC (UPF0167 family)
MPLICPECNEHLSRSSDYVKHLFKLTHKCPKCVAKEESQLKLEGKFDEYAKKMYAQNHLDIVDEAEQGFDDFIKHGFDKFMSELGETESWNGQTLSKEQIKEAKEYFKSQRDKISTYLS